MFFVARIFKGNIEEYIIEALKLRVKWQQQHRELDKKGSIIYEEG